MKYDELEPRAQERAREKWSDNELDTGWWEGVYDDAVAIGRLMGLEVDTGSSRTIRGAPQNDWDISFSGFCSQGDGLCWTGGVEVSLLQNSVEGVREHTGGQDADILSIAAQAEALYGMIVAYQMARRLSAAPDEDDYPEVGMHMRIPVQGKSHLGFSTACDGEGLPPDIEKATDTLVEAFADWIYSSLETEHDYRLDDIQIVASIEAADAEFDEDGHCL